MSPIALMSYIRHTQSGCIYKHMEKFLVIASSSLETIKPSCEMEAHHLAIEAGFSEEDLRMLHALDNAELYGVDSLHGSWRDSTAECQLHLVA